MNPSVQIKRAFKKTFNRLGLDVHKISSNPYLQLSTALDYFGINTIFDIGANEGQFSSELRSFGYQGQIICFEPLSAAHQNLVRKAAQDSSWKIHKRIAIGDFEGKTAINVSANSASSSILPMHELHKEAAKDSTYVDTEEVPISCLDSITSDYLTSDSCLFVKIDTQGFEWQVLNGAKETLKKTQGVLCEMSFVPLYKGQHLWLDVLNRLESEGFTLWSIQPGFTNPKNGRTLQMDAVFFRLT